MGFSVYRVALLVVISLPAWSQQPGGNSAVSLLLDKLKENPSDTAKISILHKLADLSGMEDALRYEQQALDLSLSIRYIPGTITSYTNLGAVHRNHSNYLKAIELYKTAIASASPGNEAYLASTYLELGIAYLRMVNLDSAKQSLLQGLKINEAQKDRLLDASIYNMLGNVSKDQNDYEQAVAYYLKATLLFKDLDNKSGLTQSVSNLGNMEYLLGNYDKALSYARESLVLAEEINQLSSIAYSNRLIGRIYRKQQKLDDAIASYTKAVEIYKSLDARRDVSETYYNTGNIYFEKGDLRKAIGFYRNALSIQRLIPDTLNMAYSYSAIGQAYFELRQYNNALLFLDSATTMAIRKKLPYIMLDVLEFQSHIYAERRQYEQAFQHHILYADLKDSLAAHENRVAAQELENKYQQAKKEEEIKTLNAERELAALQIQKKNTQRNYLLGLSLLSIVLVIVLYNRYKIKGRTAEKLKELDQVKSRFFTNLSHEFRTPLSLITGPLLKKIEQSKDDTEKEELELMARNANRLTSLINQLLDLARLESGNMKLQITEGDVRAALRLIAASFTSFAEHKKITFIADIETPPGQVYFDHDKIEKVVYNLLSNALKFTPPDGTVRFHAYITDNQLTGSVKDTGIGIPPEKIPYVFDRFYQADDSGTRFTEGTGIGLALCRELIELHKGKITVTSEAGKGSEFEFSIPVNKNAYHKDEIIPAGKLERISPVSVNIEDAKQDSENLPAAEKDTLVLLAEDNEDMQRFICKTLQDTYNVTAVSNGREALEKAIAIVPDIIITDVMMPEMDGRTLCHRIKTEAATSHIPVIMLTAKADLESKLEGLQTGADDYLTKPFNARELLVRMENLIKQRRQLQEIFRKQVIIQPRQLNVENPREKFLAQVLEIVEKNYADPLFGVDQFAGKTAMSRAQLHRKLKALTDTSPGDFLRQFRLERAKQLLLAGGFQVSEIAYQTGFNNLSNFTRSFKEFTGVTPSEFSTTHRPENQAT